MSSDKIANRTLFKPIFCACSKMFSEIDFHLNFGLFLAR